MIKSAFGVWWGIQNQNDDDADGDATEDARGGRTTAARWRHRARWRGKEKSWVDMKTKKIESSMRVRARCALQGQSARPDAVHVTRIDARGMYAGVGKL